MQWTSWSAFWHMDGSAWFVWGSYGLTLLLIVLEIIHLRVSSRINQTRLLHQRKVMPPGVNAHTDIPPSEHQP